MKKDMLPKITIIVPVYNVEKYLADCLNSLVNQTMPDIEIICVNDGSNDGSLDVLKRYASHDERIILINQPNSGVSVARNTALKHVKGEYYMFVDSDDWLDLDACRVTYDNAIQHDADCLMFSYTKEFGNHSIVNHVFNHDYIFWGADDVKRNFHRRLFGPVGDELSKPQDVDLIVSACMQLFKADKFKNIEFVDINKVGTFEDGLYQMVVYNGCRRFIYIDKPYYHYRKTNEVSITTRYKADLAEKFQHLWNVIEGYIKEFNLGNEYNEALRNRVAISMIGLGLNEIKANRGMLQASIGGGNLLNISRIKESVKLLNISSMPLPWKVFFFLCKKRLTIPLTAMLYLMEYLRTHRKHQSGNESRKTKSKCNSTNL